MRWMYLLFFRVLGWKIIGDPPVLKKYLIVVAPHTSNWDFMIGLAVRSIKGIQANFLGKRELFRPPYGWIFRKLGGYPVDRKSASHLVDQIVQIARKEERFIVAIAPEGTRSRVEKWKTGFYYIAVGAAIPIVLVSVDYPSKTVVWGEPLYPVGDLNRDADRIDAFFKDKKGKNRGVASVLGTVR